MIGRNLTLKIIGESLFGQAYEISVETIRFLRKGVRDFLTVIFTPRLKISNQ